MAAGARFTKWASAFKKGPLEEPLPAPASDANLAQRSDALERAHQAELTVSTSLNQRGAALALGSALAILLIAQFSASWLDETHWRFSGAWDSIMRHYLLPISVAALLACMALALLAVRPGRKWAAEIKGRLESIGAGSDADDAGTLLTIVDQQRIANERKARWLQIAYVPVAIAVLTVVAQSMVFAFDAQAIEPARTTLARTAEQRSTAGLPPADLQASLAKTYAPLVYLHRDEDYGPADPAAFIAASELEWNFARHDEQVAARGDIVADRLGSDCDKAEPDGCYSFLGYLARELTRPGTDSPERPVELQGDQIHGFVLDPDGSVHAGDLSESPQEPMFYEFRPTNAGVALTYWFFYGYSQPRLAGVVRKAFDEKISHEGDWENIDVILSPDFTRPLAVYYYGHGKPARRDWSDVCKLVRRTPDCGSELPGHPIVYSALGSHASYPDAKATKVCQPAGCACDRRAPDRMWAVWNVDGGLQPAEAQPWYGFGGAWGTVGEFDNGPLGPSIWKLPGELDTKTPSETPKPC